MKKYFKFIYSEIRCNRFVTPTNDKQRDIIFYAKYANHWKHDGSDFRSDRLKYLSGKCKENYFINQLFKGL